MFSSETSHRPEEAWIMSREELKDFYKILKNLQEIREKPDSELSADQKKNLARVKMQKRIALPVKMMAFLFGKGSLVRMLSRYEEERLLENLALVVDDDWWGSQSNHIQLKLRKDLTSLCERHAVNGYKAYVNRS